MFHATKLSPVLKIVIIQVQVFKKSRAMRSWVGLWQFEILKSGGLLEFLTEA